MDCFLKEFISDSSWEHSPILTPLSDLRGNKEGLRKLQWLPAVFSKDKQSLIPQEGHLCQKCEVTFCRRPGTACQHPNHPPNAKKSVKKFFSNITAAEYLEHYKNTIILPNDAICNKCNLQSNSEKPEDDNDYEPPPTKKSSLEKINKAIEPFGVNPLVFGKRNSDGQKKVVQEAIEEIGTSIKSTFEQHGIKIPDSGEIDLSKLETDSKDLQCLMKNLKERIFGATKSEQKSMLTLIPESWTIKESAEFFGVSTRMIKASRKLLSTTGSILPPPKPIEGRKLDPETKKIVIEYFHRPNVSRECPGTKDVKSVKNKHTGKREKKTKKYLLGNLKELYQHFKDEFSDLKIGLSSFISLRPEECVSMSSKGHHNVCLCVYHHNAKLLFNSIKIQSMKQYITDLVCKEPTKNCYYRRCDLCKKNDQDVKIKLNQHINSLEKTVIRYKRWLTTDGTQFVTEEKPVEEYKAFILEQLLGILKHHYLSVAQHDYFKKCRKDLKANEVIIWGDFAENYTPAIQNAIQSDYFSHFQITLHPFTVYWKKEEEIEAHSFCIISNSKTHDTSSFYAFQTELIKELKENFKSSNLPAIEKIHYFSDGCAAQYKNRKAFSNLFYHQEDFGITADWNFFPTAHGKGPCDGIGGTTKRLARIESLRRLQDEDAICSSEDLYNWCKDKITNVKYLLVNQIQIDDIVEEKDLVSRFEEITTIHGTQKIHKVTKIDNKIGLYETSEDTIPSLSRLMNTDVAVPVVEIDESSVNDWIGCVYEENGHFQWYIATIDEVNVEEEEVFVSFWKRNFGPNVIGVSFVPENNNCWIPFGHILKKIAPPKASRNRRTINISLETQESLDLLLSVFI